MDRERRRLETNLLRKVFDSISGSKSFPVAAGSRFQNDWHQTTDQLNDSLVNVAPKRTKRRVNTGLTQQSQKHETQIFVISAL